MSFSPLTALPLHIAPHPSQSQSTLYKHQSAHVLPHRLLSLPVSGWLMAVLWRFLPLLGK
jgi:hypothetical protein